MEIYLGIVLTTRYCIKFIGVGKGLKKFNGESFVVCPLNPPFAFDMLPACGKRDAERDGVAG